MYLFETDRLRCYSLSISDYAAFEAGVEPNWEGFTNPYKHLIKGPSPLAFRIPRVKKDPSFADIGLILAVNKISNEVIGSAGFHDFPDDNGMIEIGFGIVPQMQNQGFGKELLMGMWLMISKRPDVKVLRYTVAPDNEPSMHIINNLGFDKVGEQIDPEDGLELIFEKSVSDFLSKFSNL
ncbi:RimL Acetyltransferases, including N-acetylases of ribosomal proteins [actinobacterium SCGC AAA044-D11]